MSDPKRLSNNVPAEVDCRYQHTSEELKLVSKLLDVLNEAQSDLSNDYGFQGSLEVFWVDTIAGVVAFDSIYDGWVYSPTARGETPEKGGDDVYRYSDYGITPDQYHAGVAKLWESLGKSNAGPQEVDVFTQSASMIARLRELLYKTTRTPFGLCNFSHLHNGGQCGECEACEHTKEVMKSVREALEEGDYE